MAAQSVVKRRGGGGARGGGFRCVAMRRRAILCCSVRFDSVATSVSRSGGCRRGGRSGRSCW